MMNREDTILPDSLAIFPHFMAFDIAVKEMLDELKLEVLLVYLVDQVDARALHLLADQFDVLGYKGWNLCDTDAERRALIKRAIELHRYKGTKWSLQEALKSIGFIDIKIVEHVNGHWARFSLDVDNENVVITDASFADIIAMVEEYKPVRSVLDSVNMGITVTDDPIVFADFDEASAEEEIAVEDPVVFSGALYYDGSETYNGSNDHSGDADIVEII